MCALGLHPEPADQGCLATDATAGVQMAPRPAMTLCGTTCFCKACKSSKDRSLCPAQLLAICVLDSAHMDTACYSC